MSDINNYVFPILGLVGGLLIGTMIRPSKPLSPPSPPSPTPEQSTEEWEVRNKDLVQLRDRLKVYEEIIQNQKNQLEQYEFINSETAETAKTIAPIGTEFTYLGHPAIIADYVLHNTRVGGKYTKSPMVRIKYSIQTMCGPDIKSETLPIDFIKSLK